MSTPNHWGSAPLGHCAYCRKAVWRLDLLPVVHSMYGTLRLCHPCAEKEPHAWMVTSDEWLTGTTLPDSWKRAAPKKRKR